MNKSLNSDRKVMPLLFDDTGVNNDLRMRPLFDDNIETRQSTPSPMLNEFGTRITSTSSGDSGAAGEELSEEQKKEREAIKVLLDEIHLFQTYKFRETAHGYLGFDVAEMRARVLWVLGWQHKLPELAREMLGMSLIAAIKGQEMASFANNDHPWLPKINRTRLMYCFPELTCRLVNTLPPLFSDSRISSHYPRVMRWKLFGTMIPRCTLTTTTTDDNNKDVYEIIKKAYCFFMARLSLPALRIPDEVELGLQMPYILCDMKYSPVEDKTRSKCLRSPELAIFNAQGQPVKAVVQMAKRYDEIMGS